LRKVVRDGAPDPTTHGLCGLIAWGDPVGARVGSSQSGDLPGARGADRRPEGRARTLSDSVLAVFEGLPATVEPVETMPHGPLADQSSLHSLLDRIERQGLELVEIRQLPAAAEPPP